MTYFRKLITFWTNYQLRNVGFNISVTRWYPLVSERRGAALIRWMESCCQLPTQTPTREHTYSSFLCVRRHTSFTLLGSQTLACINENQIQRSGGRKHRDEQYKPSRHPSRSSCRFNTQQTRDEKFDFWGWFRYGQALMFRLQLNQPSLSTNYHQWTNRSSTSCPNEGVLIGRCQFRLPKLG